MLVLAKVFCWSVLLVLFLLMLLLWLQVRVLLPVRLGELHYMHLQVRTLKTCMELIWISWYVFFFLRIWYKSKYYYTLLLLNSKHGFMCKFLVSINFSKEKLWMLYSEQQCIYHVFLYFRIFRGCLRKVCYFKKNIEKIYCLPCKWALLKLELNFLCKLCR